MPKTYKNINGTWTPIKKIYTKLAGVWTEAKKVYKKVSGTWQIVHTGAVEYTFTSSITSGVLLSNYVNPASGDVFNIYVNSGVTISGTNGGTGATGVDGSSSRVVSNCVNTYAFNGGNGGNGGNGDVGLNLTGFGGKIVNIINNGTIKGGNGGNGGAGGSGDGTNWINQCEATLSCGCGGAGGTGGSWLYNPNNAIVNLTGNTPYNGSNGSKGGVLNRHGWPWYSNYQTYIYIGPTCNCNCSAGG